MAERIWGLPMLCLLLGVGAVLTFKTRFVQVRKLGFALNAAFCPAKQSSAAQGDVSPFAALCTALSATIGTGNIVGVAAAVVVGGPGALFWMLAAAVVGMATKYAEAMLAVRYRTFTPDGAACGGPFCYIRDGLSRRFPGKRFPFFLAAVFALAGAAAGLCGIGTVTQTGSICAAMETVFPNSPTVACGSLRVTLASLAAGAAVTLLAGLVLAGGVKRISRAATVLVPLMTALYVSLTLAVLVSHLSDLPSALTLIVRSAFDPSALAPAAAGLSFGAVVRTGVKRGVFANEAGLGSTPIAAAAAVTNDPVRQGLISMSGTFVDTLLLGTMTGLAVTVTGAWDPAQTGGLHEGFSVTALAWQRGLPSLSLARPLLALCLCFFAFTSILGWHYYAKQCFFFLTNGRFGHLFTAVYLAVMATGPFSDTALSWALADTLNAFMAAPNLLALFLLRAEVAEETRKNTCQTGNAHGIMKKKKEKEGAHP